MSGLHRIQQLKEHPSISGDIGLLCHHASRTPDGLHAVELLSALPGVTLKALFTPEHGFSGTAGPGERVEHGIHPGTGIPIHSLYGDTRIPEPEWLSGLQTLVIDLKDLGVRCYTYASTLFELLHACAALDLPVVVLDRRTPLAGIMDGPDLEEACISFVGKIPLPLVYGKSQGPLAQYLKETLPALSHLKLTILEDTGVPESPWTPPSPAIVSEQAALCYPITVWSEAIPEVWVDRGGPHSFQVWAMPDFPTLQKEPFEAHGVAVQFDTFITPEGNWPGIRFTVKDLNHFKPVMAAHQLLSALCEQLGPERLFSAPGARPGFFDQLAGTSGWRLSLSGKTGPGITWP